MCTMILKCLSTCLSIQRWTNPLEGIAFLNLGLTDTDYYNILSGNFAAIRFGYCISCGKAKDFTSREQCFNCIQHIVNIRAYNPFTGDKLVDIGGRIYFYKEISFLQLIRERYNE